MITLGSKDKSCINSRLSYMKGGALRAACKKARLVENSCSYYNNTKVNKEVLLNKASLQSLDIEDLCQEGKSQRFCPYYFQRLLQEKVQLILMPYNYIMDPRIRGLLEIRLNQAILVIDEAHNIESTAEEGCSYTFSTMDLASSLQELDYLQKVLWTTGKK